VLIQKPELAGLRRVLWIRAIRARRDIYIPRKFSMLAGLPNAMTRQTYFLAEVWDKLNSFIREFETVEGSSRWYIA
jgi:hypothetical protein